MLRKLREDDVPRPSTRLRTLGADAVTIIANRSAELRTLSRQLKGDLDCIVLKALEKERRRRYSAVSEFAADLGRCLRNEPVIAAPATTGYRLRKYVRRNRIPLAAATAFIILLVTFAVAQAIQLHRITRERDRLDRTAKFVTGLFQTPTPTFARGANRTAGDILHDATEKIDPTFADDPELQADMLEVIGRAYSPIGFDSKAASLFGQAYDIRRRVLGPDRRETLRARYLAAATDLMHQSAASEKELRATAEAQRRALGPNDPDTLVTLYALGYAVWLQKRPAEAEQLLRSTVDARPRDYPGNSARVSKSLLLLSELELRERRYGDAEAFARQATERAQKEFGKESPQFRAALPGLADALVAQRKYAELERMVREAGPANGESSPFADILLLALMRQEKYGEAEKIGHEVLDRVSAKFGPANVRTGTALYNLSCIEARLGKPEEAIAFLSRAVKTDRRFGAAFIEADADLTSLHKDPRFVAMLAGYRRQKR